VDTLVRRRRRVLVASALAALVGAALSTAAGCGPRAPAESVGTSDRPRGGTGSARDVTDAGSRDAAAALPADYRATFAKVNKARFVSQGHASGRWDVDVYANELAQKALVARSRDVPVGATVVEEHFEKSGGAAGPIMVMEKRPKGFAPEHGDWRYAVVGSQGQLVRDGAAPTCAACHDDAPMDGLFPIVEP